MASSQRIRRLLTVAEFAAAMGWKESTVRQKIWLREIEYVKVGRSIRLRAELVDALIDAGTVPAARKYQVST